MSKHILDQMVDPDGVTRIAEIQQRWPLTEGQVVRDRARQRCAERSAMLAPDPHELAAGGRLDDYDQEADMQAYSSLFRTLAILVGGACLLLVVVAIVLDRVVGW